MPEITIVFFRLIIFLSFHMVRKNVEFYIIHGYMIVLNLHCFLIQYIIPAIGFSSLTETNTTILQTGG